MVIPTHERERFCRRLLSYYRNTAIRVLVADSSREPVDYGDLLGLFGTYLHTPGLSYAHKMTRCLERVDTPYTVICADDDFTTMGSLDEAIRLLEANPGTSAVQGRFMCFTRDMDRISCIHAYAFARDWIVDAPTALERQTQAMSHYMHAYYAVHRTGVLLRAMREVAQRFEHPELLEFHVTLSAAATGKIRTLPQLFSVRQALPLSSGSQTGTGYASISQMRLDGAEPRRFDAFLECWAGNLTQASGLSPATARAGALAAIDRYIEGLPTLQHFLEEPGQHHLDMDVLLEGRHPDAPWTVADLEMLRPIHRLIRDHRDCDDALPALENPAQLEQARRIFLYGSGEAGRWLHRLLSRWNVRNVTVSGFLDSWEDGTVDGLPRLRLDRYLEQRRPDDLVVVASMHYGPILARLRGVVAAVNGYPLYLQSGRSDQGPDAGQEKPRDR